MIRRVRAFILGFIEFRSCYTTHFSEWSAMCAYDKGRALAHRITFGGFEQ